MKVYMSRMLHFVAEGAGGRAYERSRSNERGKKSASRLVQRPTQKKMLPYSATRAFAMSCGA